MPQAIIRNWSRKNGSGTLVIKYIYDFELTKKERKKREKEMKEKEKAAGKETKEKPLTWEEMSRK